ncbi:methionine/alanine import family NSS transporter small subunit [Anaerovorax odorimutans]|uniref:Methionine/alanine import family NSS transporter small subunit n=1 Tax=Anaerovorax odorimutans TaxID=109327 RepID=A0ABT1RT98_9FIRM|nr:methionine/alanine import family NSS transporter small subunit [Anaerovorax odorimutans]MCQ4638349.1 methionine/alanine import family NSS transporter small subunit [Anaerovorax odorimutans]
MSTGAIIMMLIGCIGLWGGCAFSIAYAFRHSKKKQKNEQNEAGK